MNAEERFATAQSALERGLRLADHLGLTYDDRLRSASTAASVQALVTLLVRDELLDFDEFVTGYGQVVADITTDLRDQYEARENQQ